MRFISRFGYRIIYFELDEVMFQVSLVIGIYLCVEIYSILFGYRIYISVNLFLRLMSVGGDEIIFLQDG